MKPIPTPDNQSWHQVTLAYLSESNTRLWVGCEGCQHSVKVGAEDFSMKNGVPMDTPLLTLARSLVCSRCGARKGFAWPEPYSGR